MSRYARKLDRDLTRWREAGWVTADNEAKIRRDVDSRSSKVELPYVLGILGAVLISFGIMSFVAAHWEEMPRLVRLAMIFGGLFAAYGIAGVLFDRNHPGFAHAAVLVGVAIFGAGIMLIAQMFHIEGNPPDGVLTWALGALLAGVVLQSNPALALAMLLMGLWTQWTLSDTGSVHWGFLLGWGAVTAAMLWRRWVPGLHLAALALSYWIVSLGYLLFDGHAHGLVVGIGLLVAAGGLALPVVSEQWRDWATPAIAYGMAIAFAGLIALQFFEQDVPLGNLILLAILTLALVVCGIGIGLRSGSRSLLWLGYIGFSIEVLALYFKTLETLLGSALFFVSAGAIVIALAAIAYRLHARAQTEAGATT